MAETIDIFQIHYYLKGNQHSMNAEILNKAQLEVIKISKELTAVLGFDLVLETEALSEGGIKSIFKFVDKGFSKNKNKLFNKEFKVLKPHLARIVIDVFVIAAGFYLTSDGEMKKLEKEKVKLEIEVLKKQLSENMDDENAQEITINNFINYMIDSPSIKVAKSNFYNAISKEAKVDEVSAQQLNFNYIPVGKEYKVKRNQFDNFILEDEKLEPLEEEQVLLEIVSPVLNQSSLHWNALYNGELIKFKLKDPEFQRMILMKNLKFQNGTILVCDLISNRKIDKKDKLRVTSRVVMNITQIRYSDGDVVDVFYNEK